MPCLIIIIILHLLVLGIGCKESLIFWKAGPRTSQLVPDKEGDMIIRKLENQYIERVVLRGVASEGRQVHHQADVSSIVF